MAIERSGPTPEFFKYVIENVLIPRHSTPSQSLLQLVSTSGTWLDVPSYQRGVAWEINDLEDFLKSKSILLGNVIMGQFDLPELLIQFFPNGNAPGNYAVLVDGLQRFSIGTALLKILFPLVLNNQPTMPHLAHHFGTLSIFVSNFSPVFLHNDLELTYHIRNAISSGYKRLTEDLKSYIMDGLNNDPSSIGEDILKLFLKRQIAIDKYHNFESPIAIMNTFIGINTVRVDLTPVDLLRANIVEKAQTSGWNSSEIEDMENSFSDTFMDRQGEKQRTELLPFVSIILNYITSNKGHKVFKNWTGDLTIEEVDNFLDFINLFLSVDKVTGNKYVWEIRNCGSIPWACIIGHYYNIYLNHGTMPSFLNGNGTTEQLELHAFLCGVYRAILTGRIGKTRNTAERAFDGAFRNLHDAAEEISNIQCGISLSQKLSIDTIKSSLQLADKNRSKRIFNAMLLPLNPHSGGIYGGSFSPLEFGRKSSEFNIDHLIPQSMKNQNLPGAREIESIRNFAPITTDMNKMAKATPCSRKLAQGNLYENHTNSNPSHHFYCKWLVSNQASYGPSLDMQQHLEPNMSPDIGNERISYIAEVLMDKI